MTMTYERIAPKDQWIVDDQGKVTGVRISGKNTELSGIVTSSRNPVTDRIEISLDGRNPEFKEKLLRLAAKSDMQNPLNKPPLIVPPAWQADTAYVVRNTVANNGGWYVCTTAGTSASSGGPTTVATSLPVTDGTAAWVYVGAALSSSDDFDAPAITYVGASVPSGLTSYYSVITRPDVFRELGANHFIFSTNYWGMYSYLRKANTSSQTSTRIEFMTDATKLGLVTYSGPNPYQIFVDDVRLTLNGVSAFVAAAYTSVVLDFGARRKTRKITIQGNAYSFGGVYVSPLSQVWKTDVVDNLRVVLIGDSIMGDQSQSSIQCGEGTALMLAKELGWNDLYCYVRGGTGYVNPGASADYTYAERVPQGVALNPDLWIFAGSGNDPPGTAVSGKTVADVTANALTAWRTIRASDATVPIIVFGIYPTSAVANFRLIEAALEAAITEFNDPHTYFIPLSDVDEFPVLTGAWNNASFSSSVNNTLYLSSDSVHPTDLGMRNLASRMANKIKTLVYPNL